MKISKLIKKLQSIQDKYGDIDCVSRNDYGWRVTELPLDANQVTVLCKKTDPKLTIRP